jgi:hypothetical protein
VDCKDGRCITDQAGACCDNNGCTTTGGRTSCSTTSNTCQCPTSAPRACANNVCLPNNQCCNCGGPCSTCNATTGVCGTVANGQQGQCPNGQVCQAGACQLNNVGLGQACSTAANNCSVGSCVAGTCQCTGTNPNACGGTRCVNFQTDGANCGACGVTCPMGCSGGRCNCPTNQTFVNGACRLNDGQACTSGPACMSGVCNSWLPDCDRDGFGNDRATVIRTCGNTPPGTPTCIGGVFVTSQTVNDCCDSDNRAKPGQAMRFSERLPTACIRNAEFDWNCNGQNDGPQLVDCASRGNSANTCNIGNNGLNPGAGSNQGDIIPIPQVDVSPDRPAGTVICGESVSPGRCAFFAVDTPNAGQGFCTIGCCPTDLGFSVTSCN